MDSVIGMFGYKEVTSRVTRMVLSVTGVVKKSLINWQLFDRMCGISLTMGLRMVSMKTEILLVGLLMCETIGLTEMGVL